MRIHAIPLELSAANEFVAKLHRHHAPVYRDKFRIEAVVGGKLVGVVQVGRPVSRNLDDGKTVEVVRLCTDGTKDVCSFLYAKTAPTVPKKRYGKNLIEKRTSFRLDSSMVSDAELHRKNIEEVFK